MIANIDSLEEKQSLFFLAWTNVFGYGGTKPTIVAFNKLLEFYGDWLRYLQR